MQANPSESNFQKTVIQLAEWRGWSVYHNARARGNLRSHSSRGFPDLLLVRVKGDDRRGLAWECKVGRNKATSEQLAWLQLFSAIGVPARVITPLDWDWIEETLR